MLEGCRRADPQLGLGCVSVVCRTWRKPAPDVVDLELRILERDPHELLFEPVPFLGFVATLFPNSVEDYTYTRPPWEIETHIGCRHGRNTTPGSHAVASWPGGGDDARGHATAPSPFFATSVNSFREAPRGRFSPRSHWLTSPVVTLR